MIEPKDTLAGQLNSRPLNMLRAFGHMTMPQVAEQLRRYLQVEGATKIEPEICAFTFYMLEHAVGIIKARVGQSEPLGKLLPVLLKYNELSMRIALRAYFYLLVICHREMRHNGQKESSVDKAANAGKDIGSQQKMLALLKATTDDTNLEHIANVWTTLGDGITLAQYTEMLQFGFCHGGFGSAYGGPKWGVIAKCLQSYVKGETSASMMLDTVWTLAHNTTAIFNKHVLFAHHDNTGLQEVLDLQRAGQIPHAIIGANSAWRYSKFVAPDLKKLTLSFGPLIGEPFVEGVTVDWDAVQAAGSIGKYGHYGAAAPGVKPKPKSTKPAAGGVVGQQVSLFPGMAVSKSERSKASGQ